MRGIVLGFIVFDFTLITHIGLILVTIYLLPVFAIADVARQVILQNSQL
jgi:hypothetical protein